MPHSLTARAVRRSLAMAAAATLTAGTLMYGGASAHAGEVIRVGGPDRIATALQLYGQNRSVFGGDTVVIARSDDYADALAATPLAAALRAPVIPTQTDTVEARTLTALRSAAVKNVVIIGGHKAVSPQVEAILSTSHTVTRIAGTNRYETAAKLAKRVMEVKKTTTIPVFLATGTDFPDSLTAGAAASHSGAIVLLTAGSKLPAETTAFLRSGRAGDLLAVGGPAATAMEDAGYDGDAITGADRYETAAALGQYVYDNPKQMVLVSGERFGDTLSAAAFAANKRIPLVLTASEKLPDATRAYIAEAKPDVTVLGGPVAIAPTVVAAASGAATVQPTDGPLNPATDEPLPTAVAEAYKEQTGSEDPKKNDVFLTEEVRDKGWDDLKIEGPTDFEEKYKAAEEAPFAWMNDVTAVHVVNKPGESLTLTGVPSRTDGVTFDWYVTPTDDITGATPTLRDTPDTDGRVTHTFTPEAKSQWVTLVATHGGKKMQLGPVEVRVRELHDQDLAADPQFRFGSQHFSLWTRLAHKPFPVSATVKTPDGRTLTDNDGHVQFVIDCTDCVTDDGVYSSVVDGTYDTKAGTWGGTFLARIPTDFDVKAYFIAHDPTKVKTTMSSRRIHTVKWLTADRTDRLKEVQVANTDLSDTFLAAGQPATLHATVARLDKSGNRSPVTQGSVAFYAGNRRLCTARPEDRVNELWRCTWTAGQWADGQPLYAKYVEQYDGAPGTAPGVSFDNAEAVYDFPDTRSVFRVTAG